MTDISRRAFFRLGIALGANTIWASASVYPSQIRWYERRELFPQGVASGDPDEHSVLLWTRRAPRAEEALVRLHVEVQSSSNWLQRMPFPSRPGLIGRAVCLWAA